MQPCHAAFSRHPHSSHCLITACNLSIACKVTPPFGILKKSAPSHRLLLQSVSSRKGNQTLQYSNSNRYPVTSSKLHSVHIRKGHPALRYSHNIHTPASHLITPLSYHSSPHSTIIAAFCKAAKVSQPCSILTPKRVIASIPSRGCPS